MKTWHEVLHTYRSVVAMIVKWTTKGDEKTANLWAEKAYELEARYPQLESEDFCHAVDRLVELEQLHDGRPDRLWEQLIEKHLEANPRLKEAP